MARRHVFFTVLVILAGMALGACSLITPSSPIQPGEDVIGTAAAATISAEFTRIAGQATATPELPPASPTPEPPTPTPTVAAPTITPIPLPTFTPTATPKPCNWAGFVKDVTVADNSVLIPGKAFAKIWRLQNLGTCTWTSDYDLVFDGGDRMQGPIALALPGTVRPGETVDLSVNLTSPEREGDYRGYWKLRDDEGRLFGVGANASQAVWVDIRVVEPSKVAYNFVDDICDADWRNDLGAISCSGNPGDPNGFVSVLRNPTLENGRVENESALYMSPGNQIDGMVMGVYPPFTVQSGDHFRTVIGCVQGAEACDVTYRLRVRLPDGSIDTLGRWEEVNEGKVMHIDVNLSSLAGKRVEFMLQVRANESTAENLVFWLLPRIVR